MQRRGEADVKRTLQQATIKSAAKRNRKTREVVYEKRNKVTAAQILRD